MLSKEEIENGKAHIRWMLDNGILTSEDDSHVEAVLEYIEQLESEKQKLIEKLEGESKQFDEETREIAIKLNEARDFIITDEYEQAENDEYILILEEKYKKTNIKRIRTNEILEILKGEKNE